MKLFNNSQSGQTIIILLLLMLVALSIGLAVTQRSVTDVKTSTQTEQATRAFSAAEAGIEKALSSPLPMGASVPLSNDSSAKVDSSALLPVLGTFAGIEYPPIGRETTAQFWFIDPSKSFGDASAYTYNNPYVDIYFGNENTSDKPALEVQVVMVSNNAFYTKNYYFDSTWRIPSNNFTVVPGCASQLMTKGILGDNHLFFCKYLMGPIKDVRLASNPPQASDPDCPSATCKLIMARVRLLYANENHKVAMYPRNSAQFPPQINIYNSVGTSGQSQKQLQVFRVKDVIPPWFDFAIFSVNEIQK